MPKLTITISEDVEVPEGTQIVLAPTGVIARLRLPDGSEIKPWTVYSNPETEEDYSHDELMQKNVDTGLDYRIEIEGDDELEIIQPEIFNVA